MTKTSAKRLLADFAAKPASYTARMGELYKAARLVFGRPTRVPMTAWRSCELFPSEPGSERVKAVYMSEDNQWALHIFPRALLSSSIDDAVLAAAWAASAVPMPK